MELYAFNLQTEFRSNFFLALHCPRDDSSISSPQTDYFSGKLAQILNKERCFRGFSYSSTAKDFLVMLTAEGLNVQMST